MRLKTLVSVLCLWGASLAADPRQVVVDTVLDDHILPGVSRFADASAGLRDAAQADCTPAGLRPAWGAAMDAWMGISHLRFGPVEAESRGFAIAFWPDTRGRTPKALTALIVAADPAVDDPAQFAQVSVAARGLYALEYLLFDQGFAELGEAAYRCALIRASTADLAGLAAQIAGDWQGGYADAMRVPGSGPYRSEAEVLQELFKALDTGLQINIDLRLGRPLGSFDRPRPQRAESRRAGRSLENLVLSLTALRQLAVLLAGENDSLANGLSGKFDLALERAGRLDDPVFAGVADPQGRFRVEALQQSVSDIRRLAVEQLGPALGVSAGFNALDGD